MECIAGCFGSKSPNRSRSRKNINSAQNNVEPRPARSDRHLSCANTTTGTKNRSGHLTKRTYIDDSEKSDTPLLSRLSDLTDESDLSDPIGLYQNTSKQGTQYKIILLSGHFVIYRLISSRNIPERNLRCIHYCF